MKGPARRVVVVGGGITGLTAAYRLRDRRPDLAVTVVESAARLGGKITTEAVDGFVLEGGPDSLVTFKPQAVALARELGLRERLRPAREDTAGSYVWSGGRQHPLPDGFAGLVPRRIGPLVASPLLPPTAKLRLALECAVLPRAGEEDESLESFVTRRLGREFYRRLVEPMASGIFGADPATLSLVATMPHLRVAEQQHGSLTRLVMAERRRAREREVPRPGPAVTAPAGGLGELVDALVAALDGVDVRTSTQVLGVDRPGAGEGRFVVRLCGPDGLETTVDADAVVLAVPARAVAAMTRTLTPELASLVDGFRMGSTVTVNLGYAEPLPALEGHGCLVPSREGRVARACTWSSRKFGGRAPEGHTLVRVSLGGASAPLTELDDDRLVALAREELATIAGITAEPVLARVHAWREVMPVYTVGHPDRVARVEQILAAVPGLVVAGSAFYGVSVPDCIASADRAAGAVAAVLGTSTEVAVAG